MSAAADVRAIDLMQEEQAMVAARTCSMTFSRWLLPMRIRAAPAFLAGLMIALGASASHAATVDVNAWYVLVNRNSGKAMDVAGASAADGASVLQWARHNGSNQQFQFVDSGGGYYRLRARHSGKVVDVSGASAADNADIIQWSDHNGTNQQFRLADSPNGFVRFLNRNSAKAIEVQGASTVDGAKIVQFADWGGANQQWQLVQVGSSGTTGALPTTFRWSSSGPLASAKPDAQHQNVYSVKDFSLVRYSNQWLIYATTASSSGWDLVEYSFSDWAQAASATHRYLNVTPLGPGYRAAPQLFYFAPQNLWYLVYQTPNPTYTTSTDPSNPSSWSPQRTFMSSVPPVVQQYGGGWLDFWIICDSANCYMFFTNNGGQLFRAQTTLANFPNGFGNTTVVMSDAAANVFEATNLYKVAGNNQYLLLVEAIAPSDGRRYFRSWTASSLTGSWTTLAGTESSPFAGRNNVAFPAGVWTQDISHGDMVRDGFDQTQTISPCRLQYVYQGLAPNASGDYLRLPWQMGLLTQTNSTC